MSQIAARIVAEATRTDEPDETAKLIAKAVREGKNPAAVLLGRSGGRKGGKARSEKLSPERRTEIAAKAARARWSRVQKREG